MFLRSNGTKLLDEVEGFLSAGFCVVAQVFPDVDAAQQVRSRCVCLVLFVVGPRFAQHLCLESVQHGRRSVCGLLDDGSVDEFGERIVRVFVFGSVSALKSSIVLLLDGGVEPSRGYAGLCKQRKRSQEVSRSLLYAILQVLECILDGHR